MRLEMTNSVKWLIVIVVLLLLRLAVSPHVGKPVSIAGQSVSIAEQEAITRVFLEINKLEKERNSRMIAVHGADLAAYRKNMSVNEDIQNRFLAIDVAGCPEDFRLAFQVFLLSHEQENQVLREIGGIFRRYFPPRSESDKAEAVAKMNAAQEKSKFQAKKNDAAIMKLNEIARSYGLPISRVVPQGRSREELEMIVLETPSEAAALLLKLRAQTTESESTSGIRSEWRPGFGPEARPMRRHVPLRETLIGSRRQLPEEPSKNDADSLHNLQTAYEGICLRLAKLIEMGKDADQSPNARKKGAQKTIEFAARHDDRSYPAEWNAFLQELEHQLSDYAAWQEQIISGVESDRIFIRENEEIHGDQMRALIERLNQLVQPYGVATTPYR